MAEFSNNHYVPCLVLRRFSPRITTYNIKTGELEENKKLKDVFAEKEIYPTEIENMFNSNVEGKFGNLLNNKILKAEKQCELTREENHLVKKFLLIAQMRILESIEHLNAEKLLMNQFFKNNKFPFEEKYIANESPRDRWLRNLKVILETDSVKDMLNHEDVTYEAYRWANIYYSGYLAFWDNTESGEDFIITDNGMTSERDILSFQTGGIFNKKRNYLIDRISSRNNKIYKELLNTQMNFPENFYMFSISKNRMISIINPFFRLYDKDDTPSLAKPKIWPSEIKNRKMFEKNQYKYKNKIINDKFREDKDDVFIYKIHKVDKEDSIYINLLMLDRIESIVGFSDMRNVKDSIQRYNNLLGKRINYDELVKIMEEKGIM